MDIWVLLESGFLGVTATATLFMAIASYRIARLTAQTLKVGATPQVVAYLQKHFHDSIVPLVTIAIANIGQGVAQNIRYQLRFEDEAGQQQAKRFHIANKADLKIDFLPAGEKIEIALGGTLNLYDSDADAPTIDPFEVTVQYENLEGKQYKKQSFTLDLSDFKDSGGAAKSSIVDIEKSLRSVPKIEHLLQQGIRHLQQH